MRGCAATVSCATTSPKPRARVGNRMSTLLGERFYGTSDPAAPSFELLRELLALGANLVDQLGVWRELLPQCDGPRLRVRLGIVDGYFDVEMTKVGTTDPLTDL